MAEAALRLSRCGVKAPSPSAAQSSAGANVKKTGPRLPAYAQPFFLLKPTSFFSRAVRPRGGLQAGFREPRSVAPCRGFLLTPEGRRRSLGRRQDQGKGGQRGLRSFGRKDVESREYLKPLQGCESRKQYDKSTQAGGSEAEGSTEGDDEEVSILPQYALGLESPQSMYKERADEGSDGETGRKGDQAVEIENEAGEEVTDGQWEKILVMDPKVAARHPLHQAFLQYSRWMAKKVVRYGVVFSSTFAVSCTAAQLIGSGDFSSPVVSGWLGGFVIGSFTSSAAIWRFKLNSTQRNVVVTGSTRGLGKALAREFLRFGDNVVVASRSEEAVRRTVAELRKEMLQEGLGQPTKRDYSWRNRKREAKPHRVVGRACDVSDSADVRRLAEFAQSNFGHVDLWINNAGQNPGAKSLMEFEDEEISSVVATNLVGSLVCTKEAIRFMRSQPTGGHVFNMDGNGSGGNATPQYAVYGATKCALRQLQQTLLRETASSKVGVHTASPGMVLTELLLAGATLSNKQAFNFICEQPETVAKALVPRLRRVRGTGAAINYLTPPRVLLALALAWFRRGRWFDAEGRAVYAAEAERLRAWGEPKRPSPEAAAMELVPASAWLCLNCSSLICLYLVLQNMSSS
ncbi:Chlorophyll b reductase [Klebsormidium nitens]|uniref:chlorophyll(ide) b reductase n=1 Tax=Klebsormidium nitens TaxID=105231 RepID=A0A1Y1HMG3_KLENI|nr:Chlorophyll b reductase [Klebsormidium nitens]|eukprot:GAQ77737.1 Chlorophyll b reductase [Klebsormidium nitens]